MDILFLDTNITLDLLGKRDPFYLPAAQIASLADNGEVQLCVSALTFSTVHYVLSKFEGKEVAKEKLTKLKVICVVVDLTEKVIEKALSSRFKDFEDAIQYYSAVEYGCKLIVTRNERDFKLSTLAVMNAEEYIHSYKNQKLD